MYYSISAHRYYKSMTVQKAISEWFWDTETTKGYSIYFLIDWANGSIVISQYSTVNDNVCVLGYDLIL